MYELNTLVIESTLDGGGPTFRSRSTFDDLLGAPETFTDANGNGTRDGSEPFRDTNGNDIFDAPGALRRPAASRTPTASIAST